jgi:HAD superfamily hydrolase (TIGR01509 family)
VLRFEEYWPMVGAELGLDESGLAEFFADYWDICCFDSRVEAALQAARRRFRTAVISNAWSNARGEAVKRYRFHQLFELMVFSAEEGIAKPDPEIFLRTVSRLGVPPGNALFIDDVPENVAGAQAVGMHAALSQSVEDLLMILGRI